MEKVKSVSMQQVLKDDIPVSEDLLISCEEEWNLLNRRTIEWSTGLSEKNISATPGLSLFSTTELDEEGFDRVAVLSHIQGEGSLPP